MDTNETVNAGALLANAVGLVLKAEKWGNSAGADKEQIQTNADKTMLHLSKRLIDCEEYNKIVTFQTTTRLWVMQRSVPSIVFRGIYLFKADKIEPIDEYLTECESRMQDYVNNFLVVYPAAVASARERLTSEQFEEINYPSTESMGSYFKMRHNWIKFSLPTDIPKEVMEKEKAKAELFWEEAASEIREALRESFAKLVIHTVDCLKIEPGEKPKIFRDSFVENILEFLDTFENRNLINDKDLSLLVEKARKLISGSTSREIRRDSSLRQRIAAGFDSLKKMMVDGNMITTKVSRKFTFNEE